MSTDSTDSIAVIAAAGLGQAHQEASSPAFNVPPTSTLPRGRGRGRPRGTSTLPRGRGRGRPRGTRGNNSLWRQAEQLRQTREEREEREPEDQLMARELTRLQDSGGTAPPL